MRTVYIMLDLDSYSITSPEHPIFYGQVVFAVYFFSCFHKLITHIPSNVLLVTASWSSLSCILFVSTPPFVHGGDLLCKGAEEQEGDTDLPLINVDGDKGESQDDEDGFSHINHFACCWTSSN